ncbi:hypothetical protein B1H18_26470 [Streptomyces tsukubensis]|uniref:Uncharacterized protein n=1 Tax=Streptomyces tsukubensis TaxID=83656 RepID=A0A1V4A3F2_9ACTN|nr:hypothetical protein B1H18_26470 [Streptomyces tsukubensis]
MPGHRTRSRGRWHTGPPRWLVAGLRPSATPVPWPAVARSAVGIAAPLAAGFAADRPAYGALAAMGALFGVIGDTADAYRMRVLNIAVPQLFGVIGVTVGALVHGHGWLAVAVLTTVGLVSGMNSSIGAIASVSGLQLLLNTVIGAGLPLPKPWWTAPLLLTTGGLFVLLLSLLAWPLRARLPERAAVATAYRALADQLEAAGSATYETTRRATTDALNHSYDLVLARRASDHGRRSSLVRHVAQLNVIIPLVEAASAVHHTGRRPPPQVAATLRGLADVVNEGHAEGHPPPPEPPPASTEAERAVVAALRHAVTVVHSSDHGHPYADDRLGYPAALRIRVRRTAHSVLHSRPSWQYGLRLALCVGVAQTLVSIVPVPRSYWVVLTVTFVLKPDFGSVFSRAMTRAIGTVVGLVVAAAVLSQVPIGWWDVPFVIVLAGLIPAMTVKGYAYQTAAVTPVILLISDVLNGLGFALIVPRLVDSLIGCAIVVVAGYLLWPESWHSRIGDRLADVIEDAAAYVACSFGGSGATGQDDSARARRRRSIYRELSSVRGEFQRALTEPPPMGRRAAAWWPLVVAAERVVDATTAARVRISHGAPSPAPEEPAAIARQLRELAEGVRSSETLVRVDMELEGAEDGVLTPLRQEVRAARAIASPGRGTTGPGDARGRRTS